MVDLTLLFLVGGTLAVFFSTLTKKTPASAWFAIAAGAVLIVVANQGLSRFYTVLTTASGIALACVGGYVLLGSSKSGSVEAGPTKVCPYCAETINASAVKCKHCGSDLASN